MTSEANAKAAMDSVTVTYQVAGTTQHAIITGGHINVQMRRRSTVVQVSAGLGQPVSRVHMFRHAEYVDVERGGTDG